MSENLLFNIADSILDDIEQKKQITENISWKYSSFNIQKTLEDHQKRLSDYQRVCQFQQKNWILQYQNHFDIAENEMCFNMQELIQERNNITLLNADQLFACNTIINKVDNINNEHNIFFIDGTEGTGKVFCVVIYWQQFVRGQRLH